MPKSAQLALAVAFVVASVTAASAATCSAWRRQCAAYHGYRTSEWNACMNQPQAVYDCSGGGYEGGYAREPRPDLCHNWYHQCARLYGYRTQQWSACMHQPQALADCGR